MGYMIFPGEKARECLPPREDTGDIVGRFGSWLTGDGAAIAAFVACAIPSVLGLYDLLLWILDKFQENLFFGIFSIIGSVWIIGFAMIPLYAMYFIAYAGAWLLGWACYNKWTLLVFVILVSLWFFIKRQTGAL